MSEEEKEFYGDEEHFLLEYDDEIEELKADIEEYRDSTTWWSNRFNAVVRNNRELRQEIERLNNRLKTSNDTCNYLRNTIDKAIFFIQNQELHKSNDTTGAITMKERELIDILLGSDKE